MPSLISSTTPLGSSATFTSTTQQTTRATQITGSVFADQTGTLFIDQGGDGINWDITSRVVVPANQGEGVEIDVLDQFFRVRFTNGTVAQTVFRLFIDIRDPYGAFLVPTTGPTAGGAYAVLFWDASAATYRYLGRYDGLDGWNANGNAAVAAGKSGKYASFLVSNAIVSDEQLLTTTQHTPDSY